MIGPDGRFLIVRLGSLGDVIHAVPAAAALRRALPAARIDWLVEPAYVELLGLVAGLDRRIGFDPRGGLRRAIRTAVELRRARYDAAIDLQGLVKSAAVARAAGARMTIGFSPDHLREPAARVFYTQTGGSRGDVHVVARNLALLQTLGVTDTDVSFPIAAPRTAAVAEVERMMGGGRYAILNPGAAWPNKRWPPDRFGALAAAMRERWGIGSLVLWGPGEHALARAVAETSRDAALLAPPTSLVDLPGIARAARVMISGDTGPLHVAAAMGTPVVALFGPTRPERNGPWCAADVTVSRWERCVCPYQRACRRGRPCIEDIPVSEVIDGVGRRLASAALGAGEADRRHV